MTSEMTSQVIACAPACAAAATPSKPMIAQAVNSTRSKRPSTLRSFAFSLTARTPCAGSATSAAAIDASVIQGEQDRGIADCLACSIECQPVNGLYVLDRNER